MQSLSAAPCCTARAARLASGRAASTSGHIHAASRTNCAHLAAARSHVRRQLSIARASEDDRTSGPAATAASSSQDEEEARLEAIEAATRKSKRMATPAAAANRRQIPIRGVTPAADQGSTSNRPAWKPGQLFPEGWDEMSVPEKIGELYLGQRGILFWTSQLAWYGSGVLVAAWVVFRIVLPNLGLYKLNGDLLPPTF